jgi:hypothetical protein
MNLFKFLSAIFLATQLIACGGGGAALGVIAGVFNTSSPANDPPIANAGITQNVSLGVVGGVASKVVTLDGTGSSDSITAKSDACGIPRGLLTRITCRFEALCIRKLSATFIKE